MVKITSIRIKFYQLSIVFISHGLMINGIKFFTLNLKCNFVQDIIVPITIFNPIQLIIFFLNQYSTVDT